MAHLDERLNLKPEGTPLISTPVWIAPGNCCAAGCLTLIAWYCRLRQRHALKQVLKQLDDSRFDDIGISKATLTRESRKPFWVR